jgi:hypothetical protein
LPDVSLSSIYFKMGITDKIQNTLGLKKDEHGDHHTTTDQNGAHSSHHHSSTSAGASSGAAGIGHSEFKTSSLETTGHNSGLKSSNGDNALGHTGHQHHNSSQFATSGATGTSGLGSNVNRIDGSTATHKNLPSSANHKNSSSDANHTNLGSNPNTLSSNTNHSHLGSTGTPGDSSYNTSSRAGKSSGLTSSGYPDSSNTEGSGARGHIVNMQDTDHKETRGTSDPTSKLSTFKQAKDEAGGGVSGVVAGAAAALGMNKDKDSKTHDHDHGSTGYNYSDRTRQTSGSGNTGGITSSLDPAAQQTSGHHHGLAQNSSSHTSSGTGSTFATGNATLDSKINKLDPHLREKAKEAYEKGYRDAQSTFK